MKKPDIIAAALAFTLLTGCADNTKNNPDNQSSENKTPVTSSEEGGAPPDASAESGLSSFPDEPYSGSRVYEIPQSIPNVSPGSNIIEDVTANPSDISVLDTTKQGWGPGRNVDQDNRPISAAQFQAKYEKYDALFIKPNNKTIYLTFDEGYENGYTPKILDVLKDKKAKAVFFVTYDYVKRNPDLIQRMIDEGHAIGNHSWSHPSLPTLGIEKCKEEIKKLHDYVEKEFGYTMSLLRPPMGEFSEQTLALAQSLGYQTIFWSFAYKDWEIDNQPDPATAKDRMISAAHGGGIYLLHAVSSTNAAVLGDVIDAVRQAGFQFVLLK